MSGNYDIEMSLDDTLELDTIIEKSSKATNLIEKVETSGSHNLIGIQTHTGIFDPIDPGVYKLKVNGQEISINVVNQDYYGLYLDDFEDGKLTNRDTYTETNLTPDSIEPDSSDYNKETKRIDWVLDDKGGIGITNGTLQLSDSTDYVMHSNLDIGGSSWDTKTTWEFSVVRNNQSSNNGADYYTLAMDGKSYQNKDNGNNDTYFTSNKYYMFLNDGGRNNVSLRYNGNQIIGGSTFNIGVKQKFKVIRYSDNTWELFQNGVSKGTVTHNTLTNISYMGITGDSRAKIDIDYFLVY